MCLTESMEDHWDLIIAQKTNNKKETWNIPKLKLLSDKKWWNYLDNGLRKQNSFHLMRGEKDRSSGLNVKLFIKLPLARAKKSSWLSLYSTWRGSWLHFTVNFLILNNKKPTLYALSFDLTQLCVSLSSPLEFTTFNNLKCPSKLINGFSS